MCTYEYGYVCFIDFQQVFDRVRHQKLVELVKEKNKKAIVKIDNHENKDTK